MFRSRLSVRKSAHDLCGRFGIERAGRLVGENEVRIVDERPRDRDALLLPPGEFVRVGMVMLLVEPDVQQRGSGALAALGGADRRVHHRQFDVFDGRRARQEVVLLKDEAEFVPAQVGEVVCIERGDVNAVEQVGARGRAVEAPDDVHERGLARARRSHDRGELSRRERKRDAVYRREERLADGEEAAQIARLDRRRHGEPAGAGLPGEPSSTTTRSAVPSEPATAETPTCVPSTASTVRLTPRSVRPSST